MKRSRFLFFFIVIFDSQMNNLQGKIADYNYVS